MMVASMWNVDLYLARILGVWKRTFTICLMDQPSEWRLSSHRDGPVSNGCPTSRPAMPDSERLTINQFPWMECWPPMVPAMKLIDVASSPTEADVSHHIPLSQISVGLHLDPFSPIATLIVCKLRQRSISTDQSYLRSSAKATVHAMPRHQLGTCSMFMALYILIYRVCEVEGNTTKMGKEAEI